MTSLQLISQENKTFKSLGCKNNNNHEYDESSLFPKETIVQLIEGKFPLTDYRDLHIYSGIYHKIDNKKVKLLGFCISCTQNKIGKYGEPIIIVSE